MQRELIIISYCVAILSCVLIFDQIYFKTPRISINKKTFRRNKDHTTRIRLIGSEGGSENKYVTRRG